MGIKHKRQYTSDGKRRYLQKVSKTASRDIEGTLFFTTIGGFVRTVPVLIFPFSKVLPSLLVTSGERHRRTPAKVTIGYLPKYYKDTFDFNIDDLAK